MCRKQRKIVLADLQMPENQYEQRESSETRSLMHKLENNKNASAWLVQERPLLKIVTWVMRC